MDRLVVVVPLVLIAVVVALFMQRRRPDAPAQPVNHTAPVQLDLTDFGLAAYSWSVVAFTSATCDSCKAVAATAAILESSEVGYHEAEYTAEKDLHERYNITAVPTVVIADRAGVVQRSFIGPTSATHLWAAAAELREPGSVPDGCDGH